MAVFAFVVDAMDETAARFYQHYEFVTCRDAPRTLNLGGLNWEKREAMASASCSFRVAPFVADALRQCGAK